MDIHYVVRKGEVLPHIESFLVLRQTSPCPPNILEILHHKVIADLSQNPKLRKFDFPLKTCPIHVTLDVLSSDTVDS
jgi:hypothetical protein